jgi:predicted RNA-binding Zn ribbon-like protein
MVADSQRRGVFSQIGGHPVLDLINTVQWRLSDKRRHDDLLDYQDVLRWSLQLGLLTDDEASRLESTDLAPLTADEEVTRLRALRDAVYSTLYEGAGSGVLVTEYREAITRSDFIRHDAHWGWDLPLDASLPRRRIALAAMDLLARADLAQLAQCQDAECGWVFLDSSSRQNRRWCVSADCGNRNRAREHYARSRSVNRAASAPK